MDKRFEEARKLCNVFRFTDGLNAINDSGIFEGNFRDIYPEELELYRENGNNAEASFLDLFSLFDKRDSFPFKNHFFLLTLLEFLKNPVTYHQIYSTCQLELNV